MLNRMCVVCGCRSVRQLRRSVSDKTRYVHRASTSNRLSHDMKKTPLLSFVESMGRKFDLGSASPRFGLL